MIVSVVDLLSADAVLGIRAVLAEAEWEDGIVSARSVAPGVKKNLQAKASPLVTEKQKMILAAVSECRPLTIYTIPAQTTIPLFNRYESGMKYGDHVDSPIMGAALRTDLSITVFLSDPDSYEGGELVIEEATPVKLRAGQAAVYPADRIHRVAPVTSGIRLASVFWIQSRVRGELEREILKELYDLAAWTEEKNPGSAEALRLNRVRSDLLRRWMDRP